GSSIYFWRRHCPTILNISCGSPVLTVCGSHPPFSGGGTLSCASRRSLLQDGENGSACRHSEDHLQRGEAREETGADPAMLQGCGQVPAGYAEERLHWGVRDRGRPPRGEDRCRADRPYQQVRRHLPPVRHASPRCREVGKQPASRTWVRTHRLDDHVRHHGPRGGAPQAHRWQDPWLLLLTTCSP
ncbi:unnamed protein product, partial [Ectocarpus sp. 12 AP-2014]